jgi:glycosyltransferase involved in cell wall biosynthesis
LAERAVLTVLFATRNGGHTLRRVLDAYCHLRPPAGGWKLVIVDNGSTDDTSTVIASFSDRLRLDYRSESRPGKNVALNTGLRCIEGDLVVLTDDDTVPQPGWLEALRSAADAHSDFGVFGGPVEPRWEETPPGWIEDGVPLGPTYTISEPWLTDGPVSPFFVFGPNMAVRASVFEAGHRFNPAIGPRPSRSYPMGSETEFLVRIAATGVAAWFTREAVVEHIVRPRQLRLPWILGRATRFGRGQYRLHRLLPEQVGAGWGFESDESAARAARCSSRLLKRAAQGGRELVRAVARSDRTQLVRLGWRIAYVCGYGRELVSARAGRARCTIRRR